MIVKEARVNFSILNYKVRTCVQSNCKCPQSPQELARNFQLPAERAWAHRIRCHAQSPSVEFSRYFQLLFRPSIEPSLGPQERFFGDLKNRTPILNNSLIPLHRIPEYVGLSIALYNLNNHLQFLVDNGAVSPFFLDNGQIDQHPYFNLDVRLSFNFFFHILVRDWKRPERQNRI